jgi:hypothetical protein
MQPRRALFFLVLASSVLLAQDFRAKISGRVADATEAPVPNATVSLLNKRTGVNTLRQSNAEGLYRIDFVEPGAYSLKIEVPGFATFIQEMPEVQAQADLTVNATLRPSDVRESVTVSETAVAVNFNSNTVALTIDQKLTEEVPRFDRNPFKLALLDPAVRETRRQEQNPFLSLAANSLDMGGGTSQKNDVVVDGLSVSVGNKTAFTPNQDAIQEVNIQQSTADAESGHSAGGKVSMVLKSGTNEFHGTGFYVGRNPALNATTDRTTFSNVASRNNIFGGTLGNPVKRNKLFSFFSYEQWILKTPSSSTSTSPTALERTGDFSKSLNTAGGLRTIYDPYNTVLAPNGTASRPQFANNTIPISRQDPLSRQIMSLIPFANAAPDNVTGTGNIKSVQSTNWDYWSLSERVDYAISSKWNLNGRYSKFHTVSTRTDSVFSASPAYVPGGSARNGYTAAADAIWTVSPSTVINFTGEYHFFVDDYDTTAQTFDWAKLWPNSSWYKTYQNPEYPVLFPQIGIGPQTAAGALAAGALSLGQTNFYRQHPDGSTFAAKVSHQQGSHFIKAGFEMRRSGGPNVVAGANLTVFNFQPALTANTFLSPNTKLVGDEFATFLLGALNNDSRATFNANRQPRTQYYAGYVQDDYKVTKRLTLNLGLRYELETAWHDPDSKMSRFVNLSVPNTAMTAQPPVFPAAVLALRTAAPPNTGQWIYTDSSNAAFNSPKLNFMPRIGMAFRLNNLSAIRAGFATYIVPLELNGAANFLNPPYPGFDASQLALPLNQGIPVESFADPFAAGVNPLIPAIGKGFGPYLGIGTSTQSFWVQNPKREVNNRLNISFSRQLPHSFVGEVTYLGSFAYNRPFNRDINQIDPRIGYANASKMDIQVANPYYNYLTSAVFPGPLRNQPTVATKTLLLPNPQYGILDEELNCCQSARYDALSVKLQRPLRNGYNLIFGYNYNNERDGQYYDEVASFLNQRTMTSTINPRHRISAAGTYQLPFGKGRRFLATAPAAVNAALGGWQLVSSYYWNGGNLLQFGPALVSGDPRVSNPSPEQWFDQSVFKVLPAYTQRTNPWYYDGLRGPMYWQVDSAVSKSFFLTERIHADLRVAAFNLTNHLNRADPDLVVTSATFGQALRQGTNLTGRQVEFGMKIIF